MMLKIGISGASGFIGKELLNYFPTAHGFSIRNKNWRSEFLEQEIIINLVGKAHDHDGVYAESDFYYANVTLTKKLFEVFCCSDARLFIHISSIAAVEEFESLAPLTEEATANPITWYGRSKRVAEEWLLSRRIPQGKKLIILRPPMVHGKGDKGNLVLLYRLIAMGVPYPLSSFDNRRSFLSIGNFCFFIKKIIEKEHIVPTGIYHIADDSSVSTKELIRLIKEITGNSFPDWGLPRFIVRFLARTGDFVRLIPLNTNRLKKLTGTLEISNAKIKMLLDISDLPISAIEGLSKTLHTFKKKQLSSR